MDLDWFAIDKNGNVAHFATGGGRALPEPLMNSVEDNDKIFDTFYNLDPVSGIKRLPEIKMFKKFDSIIAEDRYYNAFNFAEKGLFTYDAVENDKQQNLYCCINKPIKFYPIFPYHHKFCKS